MPWFVPMRAAPAGRESARMLSASPGLCSFPGCDRSVPPARSGSPHSPLLCSDHIEMLLYRLDEFLRLLDADGDNEA